MSGAQFVAFCLEFMERNGLTVSQYETMVNLSKDVKGTASSMSYWVHSVKAMVGGHKYRILKKEFEEHLKRDVGFLPITVDESMAIFARIV